MQSDTIHFYATNPQHMGEVPDATIRYMEHNRLCGDDIEVFLEIDEPHNAPLIRVRRSLGEGGKGTRNALNLSAVASAKVDGISERGDLVNDGITTELSGPIIKTWSFVGNTSMITRACAGLFGDIVQGKTFAEIFTMDQASLIRDTGITVSPRRERAQLLPLLATRNAIHTYLQDGVKDDFSDVIL